MIELTILPHQNDFLTAIKKAFDEVAIKKSSDVFANPIIDLQDEKIKNNIKIAQGVISVRVLPY